VIFVCFSHLNVEKSTSVSLVSSCSGGVVEKSTSISLVSSCSGGVVEKSPRISYLGNCIVVKWWNVNICQFVGYVDIGGFVEKSTSISLLWEVPRAGLLRCDILKLIVIK